MIFSLNKTPDLNQSEPASSLFRVVQQILQGVALHSVEFDSAQQFEFRASIREIADRFEKTTDYKDLLILAGEANKTIQSYHQLVEKFIADLSTEKHLAVELLANSLLRVCHSSETTAQTLRKIERDLAKASQLADMREIRAKLSECVGTICAEAEVQETQYRELKDRMSEAGSVPIEPLDKVTGLRTLKSAEDRIKDLSATGRQGFVLIFFLKNVEIVNRRFGFEAGDQVLKKFGNYVRNSFRSNEQVFRWRGPCFVVVAERFTTLELIQAEAYNLGMRGPEAEVEGNGKSMLIRLTAATTAFAIPKGPSCVELSAKIDKFAAEQFKLSPLA